MKPIKDIYLCQKNYKMATNRTFTMIKPEAVANGDSGKIIDMIIGAGFKV